MKKKVNFFGLLTIDLQFLTEFYPPANTKTKASRFAINVGGPATNAAVAYSYLGGKSFLTTSIGQNNFRAMIIEDLEKHKVQFNDINQEEEISPTFASVITIERSGERTIYSYHPPKTPFNEHNIHQELEESHMLLIDGFHLDYARTMVKKAKDRNIKVVLDGGSWKEGLERILPDVDIAICSANFFPPNTSEPSEVINFLNTAGIKDIAITRGNKPIQFFHKNKRGEAPIKQEEVIDTLGAGDFFHGAFCYYYLHDHDFLDALFMASEVALQSCKSFGTRDWMNP